MLQLPGFIRRCRGAGRCWGNRKTQVEWPVLFPYHSNPEKPPYACQLQLVICHDDGHEAIVTDVIIFNKHNQRIEHLGLSLAESKELPSTLQRHLLQQQVDTFLDTCS